MSVQFGKCNLDGRPVDPHDLDQVRPVLVPYGPDGEGYICKDNIGILYRAFHTTKESRRETQPHISKSGAVISWDGRLDNREDLTERIAGELSSDSTDLEIVAAAHERWGTDAFRELIGDWALSIWNPQEQSLVLAKDFIGTRHLHYTVEKDQVTWCTILDPLVLFAGHSFKVEEEYIAGWLALFPAAHLTPYVGIHSVPPSSFVRLRRERRSISKYWDFDPVRRVRYRTDAEYEEHFRVVFAESVRRRLRSDNRVLAELSGGMDSSAIVCVGDDVIAWGQAATPRLDTVSYYDDSEPNWNERPYFAKVEERRGRRGFHIDAGSLDTLIPETTNEQFVATPGAIGMSGPFAEQFKALQAQGFRVLVSGIGGDEVMGGVPTPLPELQDLLVGVQFKVLARQLKAWALSRRKPWFYLLSDAVRGFLPHMFAGFAEGRLPSPWLTSDFIRRNRTALEGYRTRMKVFGPLPSFQENLQTLDAMQRQLACDSSSAEPLYEKRYPYLDRDLLEFVYAISPDQLVRPGQRRSLMRRALAGVVPDEILNRRRKAFVDRAPRVAIRAARARLLELAGDPVSRVLGVADADSPCKALEQVQSGQEVPIISLMRTLALEMWLRNLVRHRLLSIGGGGNQTRTIVTENVSVTAKTSLS